MRALLRQNRWI
jgi:hypothetical protein